MMGYNFFIHTGFFPFLKSVGGAILPNHQKPVDLRKMRWLFLSIPLAFCCCMHTKHVQDYATKASQSMSKYEELPYSFTKHCLDRCAMDRQRRMQIVREPVCDCEGFEQADSVTLLLFKTLKNYFAALGQLADSKLSNYSFTKLEKSLTAGKFGDITIEKKDVHAYSTIGSTLLSAVTDGYRRKKIKQYVATAHEAVGTLLTQCQMIVNDQLVSTIRFRKESAYTYYADLIRNSSLSDAEKQKVVSDYTAEIETMDLYLKQLKAYSRSLHSVAQAHQQLYAHRNKLSAPDITKFLAAHTIEIKELQEAFQYLAKK